MRGKPKVGDVVRLNDDGLEMITGLHSWEQVEQARRMVVVEVGENLTEPVPTWPVSVDQPLINKFLISNHDIDFI